MNTNLASYLCISSLSVLAVACATDDAHSVVLSPAERSALDAYEIANVSDLGDDRLVLEDRNGATIGNVRFHGTGHVEIAYRGNAAKTISDDTGTALSCDGDDVSFVRGTVPVDAETVLAPCRDALDVAGIVTAIGSNHDMTSGEPRALLAAECTFLGANRYCQGTTEYRAFDTYCVNSDGGNSWVETSNWVIAGSSYCR
jgi:hypothetical protein